ncbi:ornithine cyclodeaminase family protein [Algihabitans albus]|uniref:ornithine cyclodeaminase family protein n=1 Tax=Algihabitans albus TaxID=2164067 RepID=UPI000E5D1826|nr:ornithine cyclodeaminase family protein [Algihabitans albus]
MSTEDATLWISEADVVRAISLPDAIDALEHGLALEAQGRATNMEKTHLLWGEGHTLHAIGATVEGEQVVGTKTWAHTAGGATPLLLIWNSETGRLRAVIEAFALGQMRTAAVTGVATRWMARPDAAVLGQVGAGKQALTQVAAVCAVRPIAQVRLFSRDSDRRTAFAQQVRSAGLGVEVVAAETAAACVADADVVTLVTRARVPVLGSAELVPGTHLNAIGAISPEREEFGQDVFERCASIGVDSLASVRRLSKEFRTRFGEDETAWQAVRPLSALVAEGAGRRTGADLTLFKAMGMGISDLAVGLAALREAEAQGLGRRLPHPTKVKPRLTRAA